VLFLIWLFVNNLASKLSHIKEEENVLNIKKMRYLFFLLVSLPVLLSNFFLISIPINAQAAVPIRIASFQVNTLDGKSMTGQTFMTGASYQIVFTLEVAAGIKDKGILTTGLSLLGDHYWSLKNQYPGINTTTWQPGQAQIDFDTIAGTVQLELQGTVPDDYVVSHSPGGDALHISKQIPLLSLSLPGGQILEKKTGEVIDKSIETYRSALQNKQNLVDKTTGDPRYVDLVKALIATSKNESNSGYTDAASTTLSAIPASGWIVPQSSTFFQWIVVGVLAIFAVLFLLLLVRSKSEVSFIRKRVDDQAKRLEILTSRVRGIGDTKLAGEIDKVKQELEDTSGR
jgi:hypothetical protein